ncbi:MAG: hypothetical protein ACRC6S_03490 [Shewanella sp.]
MLGELFSLLLDFIQEYSLLIFLGITGAIFANVIESGGGVIFIPVFQYLQQD